MCFSQDPARLPISNWSREQYGRCKIGGRDEVDIQETGLNPHPTEAHLSSSSSTTSLSLSPQPWDVEAPSDLRFTDVAHERSAEAPPGLGGLCEMSKAEAGSMCCITICLHLLQLTPTQCDQARPCVHCTRAGVECVPRQGDAQEHRPLATSSTQPASSRNDEADNAPADTTVVLPETSIVDLSTMVNLKKKKPIPPPRLLYSK